MSTIFHDRGYKCSLCGKRDTWKRFSGCTRKVCMFTIVCFAPLKTFANVLWGIIIEEFMKRSSGRGYTCSLCGKRDTWKRFSGCSRKVFMFTIVSFVTLKTFANVFSGIIIEEILKSCRCGKCNSCHFFRDFWKWITKFHFRSTWVLFFLLSLEG